MKRILVADDLMDIRNILRYGLERAGYEVILAEDGFQALELALSGACDAAIIDIRMPKLNGFDVTAQLRAHEATCALPIILLTGSVQPAELQDEHAKKADAYIIKPFTISEIITQLQASLQQS